MPHRRGPLVCSKVCVRGPARFPAFSPVTSSVPSNLALQMQEKQTAGWPQTGRDRGVAGCAGAQFSMSSAVAHSFAPVGAQYDVYTSTPVIAPSKIAPPVMTPAINGASLGKGPSPDGEGEAPYTGGTMAPACNVSLAPDNLVISSVPAPSENAGTSAANGVTQPARERDISQKSDGGDASSTDETIVAEPGCSPYDPVAIPPPSDAAAAQMLTEHAASLNASLEHSDHAQVTRLIRVRVAPQP